MLRIFLVYREGSAEIDEDCGGKYRFRVKD
jgi:hypothetical protein